MTIGAIADRFEMIARAQPERRAVSAGGQQTSYGELATHAARIAHRLLERDVRQGDRIAVCFEHVPRRSLRGLVSSRAA
jgi:acyl-CoA synthetase (AMP-forming)/AMP-acid ligase II